MNKLIISIAASNLPSLSKRTNETTTCDGYSIGEHNYESIKAGPSHFAVPYESEMCARNEDDRCLRERKKKK